MICVHWTRRYMRYAMLFGVVMLLSTQVPAPVTLAQPDTSIAIPCDGSTSADYNGECGPSFTLPRWSDATAWNKPQYYETILLADFDGDGADELLARSSSGFIINRWSREMGQWVEQGVQSFPPTWDFSDAAGWDRAEYYSTIQAAYLGYEGGQAASLLMQSAGGIVAFQWDGAQHWTGLPAGPEWTWSNESSYSTIQTWGNWLIGRATDGIQTWRFENGAWLQLSGSGEQLFSDAAGWDEPQYYETIKLVDLDSDGTPELVGRSISGLDVYRWSGSDWASDASSTLFSDAGGWDKPQYYRTLVFGDIDGKPGDDVLGRGAGGVVAYSWGSSGWAELPVHDEVFPDAGGWDRPQYYETIQLFTLKAGQTVLTARGAGGPLGYEYELSTGRFEQVFAGPALADGPNGTFPLWAQPSYYDTIHYGDVNGDAVAELVARGQYGIRSWSYDTASNSWQRPLPYGFQPFSDSAERAAFELVNDFLNIEEGSTIRDWYTSLDSQVGQNYQDCLNYSVQSGQPQPPTQTCYLTPPEQPLANPGNVTAEQWDAMVKTLQTEIAQAGDVDGYFNESVTGVLNALFAGDDNSLANIANLLEIESKADDRTAFSTWFDLLIGMAEALVNLTTPIAIAAVDSFGTALGALEGMSSPDTSSFEGNLSAAQADLTRLNNQAADNNNAFFQYVAQDYGLLYAVGEMVSSQVWLITADIQNNIVSVGRRHFATWTYQLLLPTVWALTQSTCGGGDCPNFLAGYVIGPSGTGEDWARYLYDKDNEDILDPAPTALRRLFDPVQEGCDVSPDSQDVWSYATCNLGASRAALFDLRDGWSFDCMLSGGRKCPQHTVAIAAAHSVAGDAGPTTVYLGQSGPVHTVIYGGATFNAADIDPTTVTMAGAPVIGWWVGNNDLNSDGTVYWPAGTLKDIDGDGYLDALLNFHQRDLQLTAADTTALIEGSLISGETFMAALPVTVIPAQ